MVKNLGTPCIGVCSTVYGDNVCRGCKRMSQEIIDWNGLTEAEKRAYYKRLNTAAFQIVEKYIVIDDIWLLSERITAANVRVQPEHDLDYALLMLLRVNGYRITNPSVCGFQVKPKYKNLYLEELYKIMDNALYQKMSEVSDG